ncbi:MAG: methyltransferase domain-containing protein [Pseudomonadota bacterium]
MHPTPTVKLGGAMMAMATSDLEGARRWYAEDIAAVAPVAPGSRVVEAFAHVAREDFLGPGPWQLHSRLDLGRTHLTADTDPRHLYHDVLVTIAAASGINNGLPSLWARVFEALAIRPGARVLQVGAGTGYYTAILAELVGASGRVLAYEVEPDLAARAAAALAPWPQVAIIARDATTAHDLPAFDVLVACAGATHVPADWLAALPVGGRMMLPMTGSDRWGFLMHLQRTPTALPVRSLGPCGFYPCAGARKLDEARALSQALTAGSGAVKAYQLGAPPKNAAVWMQAAGFWISRKAVGALGDHEG